MSRKEDNDTNLAALGMALGTMVAGAWLSAYPTAALLLLSGAAQFASGFAYYMFCKKHESVLKTRA